LFPVWSFEGFVVGSRVLVCQFLFPVWSFEGFVVGSRVLVCQFLFPVWSFEGFVVGSRVLVFFRVLMFVQFWVFLWISPYF
jgi:hypothetical protein